jgi:ribosomal protein L6P/L9E
MSRIGKKPVRMPDGVTATVDGQIVTAKGPKGELKFTVVNDEVLVAWKMAPSTCSRATSPRTRAPSGACRAP